jgi:hypothetical protein
MGKRNRRDVRRAYHALNPEQASRIAALAAAQERLGSLKMAGAAGGALALAALAGSIALGAPSPPVQLQPPQTDVFGQAASAGDSQGFQQDNPQVGQGAADQGGQTFAPGIVSAPS